MFADRRDAGRRLAERLQPLAAEDPVVVALPRGGVPVAYEVARALGADLEVLAVGKLGAPGNPELGVGAIAEDGTVVLDPDSARLTGMTEPLLRETVAREAAELQRRVAMYRGGRGPADVAGRTVIIVDDGVATGVTDLAAVRAVRAQGAARIVVAVPVGARRSLERLAEEADEVICLLIPASMRAVGHWFEDFSQVSDAQVLALLRGRPEEGGADPPARRGELAFDLDGVHLYGDLALPRGATGLVLFSHGSGSSRHSPRNRSVAEHLQKAGLATLLFDLLSEPEQRRRENVFDIPLLSGRLEAVTRWALADPTLGTLAIGYFGASTGAGAALHAAGELGQSIGAVVSRGGRPDLAADRLPWVTAPTLLIVGGEDQVVLQLNRRAAALLRCPHETAVVPGAGHLFEEPGALEAVSQLAADWFAAHLRAPARPEVVQA